MSDPSQPPLSEPTPPSEPPTQTPEPTPAAQTDPMPDPSDVPEPEPEAQTHVVLPEPTPPAQEAQNPDPPAQDPNLNPPAASEQQGIVQESSPQAAPPEVKERSFIQQAVSFKEESNLRCDLTQSEKTTLDDLKKLVQESLSSNTLVPALAASSSSSSDGSVVSIWGVPLLKDDRTDVILLKFLRARDFRVNDALTMLKNTLKWRIEFKIEQLVDEELGDELDKVVFMHGHDREGHPVCYNVYGEFQNKELYAKMFSSEEKREMFLKRRIQFLERSIRKQLSFWPGGVNTIFQVNDFKNAPGPGKRELRQATRQALQLLQDNYPEFVAKQVFINVPWWYVAFYTMMSPFMTQRTKSKFVFAGPSKTSETLFKYVSPEQVPIQYGGLSVDYCDWDTKFTVDDPATEIYLKPTTKQYVEILCSEQCVIGWELRVVGWEVTYSAEFVPASKQAYTVVIQKGTKMTPHDDPVISGSFEIKELGKIVLIVDNPTFKKRKLIYRYKVLPSSD